MKRFTAVWDDFLIETMKEDWERPCVNRFQIVGRSMIEKRDKIPSRIHDKYVTHLRAVMFALRDENTTGRRSKVLAEHNPAYTAWRYWNRSKPKDMRWRIEAFIMAGATDQQLLKMFPSKAGIETFEYFRKLFFDIAPYEDNNQLILINIINVAYDRGGNSGMECDLFWKIAARRYRDLEDFTQFMEQDLCGLDVGLQQTLRQIQEGSFMKASTILSLKPNDLDERSIMTVNLAANAMFISHDNAHKIAEIAFQEKVGKVVDHLSIRLIKSDDPLPDNAKDIKKSDPIHHARAANKAESKHAAKVLEEAKMAERVMRNRYQVMEAG